VRIGEGSKCGMSLWTSEAQKSSTAQENDRKESVHGAQKCLLSVMGTKTLVPLIC